MSISTILRSFVLVCTLVVSFMGTRLYLNSQDFSYPRSTVHNIRGDYAEGSGVMIADRLMLTAFHVTGPEAPGMTVNGKPVKVLKYDEANDITLLEVEQSCPCIPISTDLPDPDQRVIAVGFPLGLGKVTSIGLAQHIHGNKLLAVIPIAFGNSGGGLFMWNGWHWVLAGITVQVSGAPLGMGFGIPVFHLTKSVPSQNILKFIHNDSDVPRN